MTRETLRLVLLRALARATVRRPSGVDQAQVLQLARDAAGPALEERDLLDVLEGLIAAGLVAREFVPDSRRRGEPLGFFRVRLTDDGRAAVEAARGHRVSMRGEFGLWLLVAAAFAFLLLVLGPGSCRPSSGGGSEFESEFRRNEAGAR